MKYLRNMKNIEKTELKAYKKPAVRVIDVQGENIMQSSDPDWRDDEV